MKNKAAKAPIKFEEVAIVMINGFIIKPHKVEYKLRVNRVQISCDIVQLIILYRKKKDCLTCSARYDSLSALLFPPYEKWAETLGKKKVSNYSQLSITIVQND